MTASLVIPDSMLIDHKDIDAEHAVIAKLVTWACQYYKSGDFVEVGFVMDVLAKYVTRHLFNEEQILEQMGYYKLQRHKVEHVVFLNRFTDFHEQTRASGYTKFDGGELINIMLMELITADIDVKSYLDFTCTETVIA